MAAGILNLFGKKNLNKIVDGAITGVDKLFYTKEEKADFLKKVAENQLQHLQMTINESSARSYTRRYIAVTIMGAFVALLIFGAVIYGFNPEWAEYVLDQAKSLSGLALMVAGFYFGSYALGQYIINPLKKQITKNKKSNDE